MGIGDVPDRRCGELRTKRGRGTAARGQRLPPVSGEALSAGIVSCAAIRNRTRACTTCTLVVPMPCGCRTRRRRRALRSQHAPRTAHVRDRAWPHRRGSTPRRTDSVTPTFRRPSVSMATATRATRSAIWKPSPGGGGIPTTIESFPPLTPTNRLTERKVAAAGIEPAHEFNRPYRTKTDPLVPNPGKLLCTPLINAGRCADGISQAVRRRSQADLQPARWASSRLRTRTEMKGPVR